MGGAALANTSVAAARRSRRSRCRRARFGPVWASRYSRRGGASLTLPVPALACPEQRVRATRADMLSDRRNKGVTHILLRGRYAALLAGRVQVRAFIAGTCVVRLAPCHARPESPGASTVALALCATQYECTGASRPAAYVPSSQAGTNACLLRAGGGPRRRRRPLHPRAGLWPGPLAASGTDFSGVAGALPPRQDGKGEA